MTNEESARDLLGEVLKCGGTANGKIVLAAALREAEARGLERGAEVLAFAAEAIRTDAASLTLGARSGRATFLEGCPAYDVEKFRAFEWDGAAAALRAEATRVREGKP